MDSSIQGMSTKDLRKPIQSAFKMQFKRQGKLNASLKAEEIEDFCYIEKALKEKLLVKSSEQDFSSRAIHSVLKLSRSIADMQERETIIEADLDEAIRYRKNEGGLDILF